MIVVIPLNRLTR